MAFPMPKLPSKSAPKSATEPPTFLEKGKFRRTDELMHEIKKPNYYKNIPTYGKKLSQNERMNLIKTLQKASGAVGGLSKERIGRGIKKLEKEKMQAHYGGQYKRVKELDQQIKQAKAWGKSW